MFKRILLTGALSAFAAATAFAQEAAISGKDFLSGAGDAKLAEIAREAAASGKVVVITAPKYWQDKAAAKIHAAAPNAGVRQSEGFFENVMVRVEDKAKPVELPAPKAEAPKVVEAPVRRAEPKPEPRPVAAAPKPAPPVERVAPPPPRVSAPVEAAAKPVVAAPVPQPAVVTPPPAPPTPAPAAKPAPPPVDPAIAIRHHFEQNLNGGKPAEGIIQVAQLQTDDTLLVDGTVRAVVRRFGPRTQLFWLEGDLNLDRAELVPNGNNRYKVSEPIHDVANPSLRASANSRPQQFTGNVPAPGAAVRTKLQKQYNEGRDITESVSPTELRHGDVIHSDQGSAVVVRRTGVGYEYYWLVGELDMHQAGLQQQGNAYLVVTDTIK